MGTTLNPYNHHTVILFKDGSELPTHWASHDDYTTWTDIDQKIQGSTLADNNRRTDTGRELISEIVPYLEQMSDEYLAVHTNNVQVCNRFLWSYGLLTHYATPMDSIAQYYYSPERITNEAAARYIDETQ